MLEREARWLGARIAQIPAQHLYPMVNIGSSTAQFRTRDQPWIHAQLFAPAERRGLPVIHVDRKAAPGVDVVGDLDDPAVVQAIAARGPRSVLCSNLLEHLEPGPRRRLCAQMAGLVPPGGYLLVTVPRAFPYHPDPIDTGFRPTVAEVAALFPGCVVEAGEELRAGHLWSLLPGNVLRLARKGAGMALGGQGGPAAGPTDPSIPRERLRDWLVPWLWRPFRMTCVVLRRPEQDPS